jgi:hypothetical protein
MKIGGSRFVARRFVRLAAIAAIALPLAGLSSIEALFAPSADLWPRWQAHDRASTSMIDHGRWTRFLQTYVSADADGVHRVDYAGVNAVDRAELDRYIEELSGVPIDGYNRGEQRAFWINLYNALTVRLILRYYPVGSIRDIDISPGLFSDGPWDMTLVTVAGEELTLNDIEHRILRPIWDDPRIHYGVNCASIGCPNLLRTAFTGNNTDNLLDMAARGYVNSPRGVRFENGEIIVSSIYAWFQGDFGGDDAGIIQHLARYAKPELAARLDGVDALTDHDYDWSLNAARALVTN